MTTPRSSSNSPLRLPVQGLTLLYSVAIVLVLLLAWEALKEVGRSSDYNLNIFGQTLDLSFTKDINMPHLRAIFAALFEPAQRNGPPLIEVLAGAALYTLRSALLGFTLGTILGLLLAVVFVHSPLLARGLMPYVVASQTVPILAIAPMVIIWTARIEARPLGVPLIAAYLAFFPVTIYALRGLADVPQTALELMQSYAATRREILFKLRFPNAIPYIFTALKITAPASVVGAIIGELPAGIQDGLGGAILNYAQYYSAQPTRLWATNLITALVGIAFFGVVALAERWFVRWKPSLEASEG
jgi:NitT/TauT family transport system permease protein